MLLESRHKFPENNVLFCPACLTLIYFYGSETFSFIGWFSQTNGLPHGKINFKMLVRNYIIMWTGFSLYRCPDMHITVDCY